MKPETIATSAGPQRVRCYALASGGDRFTILWPNEPSSASNPSLRQCLGMSGHASGMPGRHLGKRVPFAEMPDHLKARVIENR